MQTPFSFRPVTRLAARLADHWHRQTAKEDHFRLVRQFAMLDSADRLIPPTAVFRSAFAGLPRWAANDPLEQLWPAGRTAGDRRLSRVHPNSSSTDTSIRRPTATGAHAPVAGSSARCTTSQHAFAAGPRKREGLPKPWPSRRSRR